MLPQYDDYDEYVAPGIPPRTPNLQFDPLYWARQLLDAIGLNAIGWRVNGSLGYKIGGSGSYWGLYNWRSNQGGFFVDGGGQGYTMGASASGGLVLGFNVPDNGSLTGFSHGPTFSLAKGFYGIDASLSIAAQPYKGETPVIFYIGYAGGEETTGGYQVSHTWTLQQALDIWRSIWGP